MIKKTIERRRAVPVDLPGVHPVLARIFAARGVRDLAELDHSVRRLAPPDALKGVQDAASILHEAIEAGARVVIVGDFDADGATSCAVAMLALRSMGAQDVHYLVPNRFDFGYGLTPEIVGVAAAMQPDCIVTVDNGISSHAGVEIARELGITVVVTDHHLPAARLPQADAIVNPNQAGDRFASKSLAGVGVIFYVMLALRARLRAAGWFDASGISEPNLAELLDLVALGTVADLVPLDCNNRILVAQGLARIRAGQCRPGITALLKVAGRDRSQATSRDLAFSVAPRLNAAGRLQDMSLGIECLLSGSAERAQGLAATLDELNRERRAMQSEMQEQADRFVGQLQLEGETPAGICLFDAGWHEGLVGLIASQVKERTNRPVVAFARTDSGQLKGSARSVDGLHIRDLLEELAARNSDLLEKFGGHAMAAGLSIEADQLTRFTRLFSEAAGRHLGADGSPARILSDGPLADAELGLSFAESLRQASPWGQHFPEPLFDDCFDVLEQRVVGQRHLKLRVRRVEGQGVYDAIAFGWLAPGAEPARLQTIRAAYRLDVNEYGGIRTPQLIVEYLEAAH